MFEIQKFIHRRYLSLDSDLTLRTTLDIYLDIKREKGFTTLTNNNDE
jgi:hypothetical protein